MTSPYTPAFYDLIDQRARSSAEAIVPIVVDAVKPHSVVDVGCGLGTWLSVFVAHGIDDVAGVDGDWVEIEKLRIPRERFTRADVSQPIDLKRRFDLAVCLEVGEHIAAAHAATLVDSLTSLAPAVAFSAAVPFQTGVNHVNEQWPDYWMALFAARGFRPVDCIRRVVWENDNVEWWYAQNAFLFVDAQGPHASLLASANPSAWPTRMVHPKNFLRAGAAEARKPEESGVVFLLSVLRRAIGMAIRKRLRKLAPR